MKILIVGNGGREHAIAEKLSQSERVEEIYLAEGNAGTSCKFTNVAIDGMDFKRLKEFSLERHIDLVVVGPEDPLCGGLADYLRAAGIQVFGVDKECAQFEGSKQFTKEFLQRHQISTAAFAEFTDYDLAVSYLRKQNFPIVIKADGLCLGKGVIIPETFAEGKTALQEILLEKRFGDQGNRVVIEEFLTGEEMSLICLVSDNQIYPLESARDYKRIGDGDTGENTGGVGCYSPGKDLSIELQKNIDKVLQQISQGFQADGYDYNGVLFVGFMNDGDQPNVLEFNVRFGDPETQVLLPRLDSDLLDLMLKVNDKTLTQQDLVWNMQTTCAVVMVSDGYPEENFDKGQPIYEIPKDTKEAMTIHNGTAWVNNELVTNGGRVLTVVGSGENLASARSRAYSQVKQIKAKNLVFRTDIGL